MVLVVLVFMVEVVVVEVFNMRDNPDGVLELLNIDVTTFDSILNFMYTGRFGKICCCCCC